tara:strand:+ start:89 stop:697 length:609 start_codon:yes stop_codon:yes gene_type:complete
MSISGNNYKIEGIKEIMFVNHEIEKDLFMSMSSDKVREFIEEKNLEESIRVFLLDKDYLKFPNIENIDISTTFKDKKFINLPLKKDKIKFIFWEELKETEATIDFDSCDINFEKNLKVGVEITSNLMFDEIQDYLDEYVFSDLDYKILVNGKSFGNNIESESFGITINKKLIISSGSNKTQAIDLKNEDELKIALEAFKKVI